jgi:hypothetical protein
MQNRFKCLVFLCLLGPFQLAWSQANVCLNDQKQRVFSEVSCASKGWQVAKHDFPVSVNAPIQAIVIAPPSDLEIQRAASKANAPKHISPWGGGSGMDIRILIFFGISLTLAASILGYQIFLFFKNFRARFQIRGKETI